MICKLSFLHSVYLFTPLSSVGAYFGDLVSTLRATSSSDSVSPFVFLRAFGTLFKGEDGLAMNGDSSQDTSQFINELLKRLHEEETVKRTIIADAEKPGFVQDLFNLQESTKVSRHCRRLTRRE